MNATAHTAAPRRVPRALRQYADQVLSRYPSLSALDYDANMAIGGALNDLEAGKITETEARKRIGKWEGTQ